MCCIGKWIAHFRILKENLHGILPCHLQVFLSESNVVLHAAPDRANKGCQIFRYCLISRLQSRCCIGKLHCLFSWSFYYSFKNLVSCGAIKCAIHGIKLDIKDWTMVNQLSVFWFERGDSSPVCGFWGVDATSTGWISMDLPTWSSNKRSARAWEINPATCASLYTSYLPAFYLGTSPEPSFLQVQKGWFLIAPFWLKRDQATRMVPKEFQCVDAL